MNESVKVYRERDMKRLEACDRLQQSLTEAKAASEQAKEAFLIAIRLESDAMAAWSRHSEARIYLEQLLNPQLAIKNEQAGGQVTTVCAPDACDTTGPTVVETTKTTVTPPDSLASQEATVWCMAYTEERRAQAGAGAFVAAERARDAANAAIKAFREAGSKR